MSSKPGTFPIQVQRAVPALVSTSPTGGGTSADSRVTQMRAVSNSLPSEYPVLFERYKGDELLLGSLGEAAFQNGAYDWTINALEQAKLVESSEVWQGAYPFLIGAYLLVKKHDKATKAVQEMFVQIEEDEFGYLTWPSQISSLMRDFGDVRETKDLTSADKEVIDQAVDRLEAILIQKRASSE